MDAAKRPLVRKDLGAGLAFGSGSDACQWQTYKADKAYGTGSSCLLVLLPLCASSVLREKKKKAPLLLATSSEKPKI